MKNIKYGYKINKIAMIYVFQKVKLKIVKRIWRQVLATFTQKKKEKQ